VHPRTPVPTATRRGALFASLGVVALLAACANTPSSPPDAAAQARRHAQDELQAHLPARPLDAAARQRWLDRVTWGASADSQAQLQQQGLPAWLAGQLYPHPAPLPALAQGQIDALRISREPFTPLMLSLEAQRQAADAQPGDEAKRAARQAYQQELNRLAREAQQRFVLRALYSPNQLQEQMTWFWMNHFNVNLRKANLRAMLADYEDQAIRPHALGRFRDLLGANLRHPAMLRYLDNAQNASARINENYARELMELHTLGVGSGYTQADVQELARVLTGVGISLKPLEAPPPRLRPQLQADYRRDGLFEFNPARHDYGAKTLLGQPLRQRGMAEVDEALDRLARAPATAHFIAHKLAVYFVADEPPPALVTRMAERFARSDGDIAATLATLFASPEFAASLGHKFRDPVHYALASVRLAYGGRVVGNPEPLLGWIHRMGQPLYGHETPDGYPLTQSGWASAGQMTTRFEIARALGASGAVLFRTVPGAPLEQPPYPPLQTSPVVQAWLPSLGANTRTALAQARNPQDWNTYLLASPEMMLR
jgi:uncharacterized protein (DUF1800 family)